MIGFRNTLQFICDELNEAVVSVDSRLEIAPINDEAIQWGRYSAQIHVHDTPLNHRIEFIVQPDGRLMVRGRRFMAVWYEDRQMRLAFQPLKATILPAPHKLPAITLMEIITDYYLGLTTEWYLPPVNQMAVFNLNKQWAINQQKSGRPATFKEQNHWEHDLFRNFAEPQEKINGPQ